MTNSIVTFLRQLMGMPPANPISIELDNPYVIVSDQPVTISGRVVNGSSSDYMKLHWYSYQNDDRNGLVDLDGSGAFSFVYTPNGYDALLTLTAMSKDGQIAGNSVLVTKS